MPTIAVFSRDLEYYPVFLIVYRIYSSVIAQHRKIAFRKLLNPLILQAFTTHIPFLFLCIVYICALIFRKSIQAYNPVKSRAVRCYPIFLIVYIVWNDV